MCQEKQILYRTETFSGSGERDAIEVMRYEIFELNNSDILDTLFEGILAKHPIAGRIEKLLNELDDNGYIDDVSETEQRSFLLEVLQSVKDVTGKDIKFALWLTDKDKIASFYGRDMCDATDYDAYEVGPVMLSGLNGDGNLYGYETLPKPLEFEKEPITVSCRDWA